MALPFCWRKDCQMCVQDKKADVYILPHFRFHISLLSLQSTPSHLSACISFLQLTLSNAFSQSTKPVYTFWLCWLLLSVKHSQGCNIIHCNCNCYHEFIWCHSNSEAFHCSSAPSESKLIIIQAINCFCLCCTLLELNLCKVIGQLESRESFKVTGASK